MRVLMQRVSQASVAVDGQVIGAIGRGYVLLVGVGHDDSEADVDMLAGKIVNLRLFADDNGKFDRSLLDVSGEALVVSQFTLYGDPRKGRRPDFTAAARPEKAKPLCDAFAVKLRELGVGNVQTGRFGAAMAVEIHNDGPVTLWLES
ncbi:MAG: D-tyrosyl-tRNA(Tyr) deacylase [Phycisphaeraceae bacterium]|nr:D-tyrosyl-tRNA(Tyr) deacylase [Phycisphaeraceae bacterium]